MDLKLEVYSPALELLGLLEVHRSVIWESKAFGAGSFSLESLITEESRALLVPDNILWIEGDTAGVIEHIQQQAGTDGPYITVKGRDLTGLLDRRILWGLYDLNATPPAVMHHLVQDSAVRPTRGDSEARKLPGLALLDAPAGGNKIRYQKTGGSLLDALELLGEAYQVAFGVRFNAAVPRMEFWTRWGADRSVTQSINEPVFYSTELDDVLESEYSYDSANYRNVSLVAGEGEGKDRVLVTVEGSVEPTPTPPEPPGPTPVTYTITLSVDPEGGGTASGGGSVSEGTNVTLTAVPAQGYEFSGWREGTEIVSTDATYTFQASADRSLTAVFTVMIPTYTVTLSIDPAQADWGSVSGGGRYQDGTSVTVTATPAEGYQFVAWQEGGQNVSTDASYTFTAGADRALVAVFAVEKKELVYHGVATALATGRTMLAATTIGSHAIFGGGSRSTTRYSTVDAYDEQLTRSTPDRLGLSRSNLSATSVGDYALFCGGLTGTSTTSPKTNVDAYDAQLTHSTPTALSAARSGPAAGRIGGHALIAGGQTTTSTGVRSSVVDAYDEELVRTTKTALSVARSNVDATLVGNHLLLAGGTAGASSVSDVTDAYNNDLTRTTPTALSVKRSGPKASSVGDFALFCGGQRAFTGTSQYSDVVDAYSPSLTRTTPTKLSTARVSSSGTTVGNFAVFCGGYNGGYLATSDAYDDTLTHTTPTALSLARSNLVATTINDYALFGGGAISSSGYSNVVNVYTLK